MERKMINRYWAAATWFVVLVLLVGVGMLFMNEAIRSQFTESEPARGLGNLSAEMGAVALLSIVAGLAVGALIARRRRMVRLRVDRLYPL
jgi:uncharacterized protein YneF (UPF0154 family)